jgi:hypothetical protein
VVRLFLNPCLNRSQAQQALDPSSMDSLKICPLSPLHLRFHRLCLNVVKKNKVKITQKPIISTNHIFQKKQGQNHPKTNHINQSYLPKKNKVKITQKPIISTNHIFQKKQGQNHPKTRCQETFSMLFHGGISAGLSGVAVMVSQQRCKALALSLSEMVQEN